MNVSDRPLGRPGAGVGGYPSPAPRRAATSRAMVSLLAAAFAVATPAAANVVEVIEYYHAGKDHYFFTSVAHEIVKLDTGVIKGWARTGKQFFAHEAHVNGTNSVCRFYMPVEHGDSHFFSASTAECAKVRSTYPAYVQESEAVMHIAMPHPATGACGVEQQPVYRVWNKRKDSNHRYVTDKATRDQMVAQGWVAEGHGPDAVAMCTAKSAMEPDPVTAALPPPCKGLNPNVPDPTAPHGMYVWAPNAYMLGFLESYVIGKDPTLCGASLLVYWSTIETAKGVYDWSSVTAAAQPFVNAGLTVNLLFSEATEGATNTVTPAWVFAPTSAGGAGATSVTCTGEPQLPVYWDPAYEAAWTAFIAAAVKQFSFGNSSLSPNIGYMRFATGGGAEGLVPGGVTGSGDCPQACASGKDPWSYSTWLQHQANIIAAMASQPTDKQIVVSLGQAPGGPNVYDVSNRNAALAAPKKIGFAFENLGTSGVAAPGTTPAPCNPTAGIANLHWCPAYSNPGYIGEVPFAMQPITATTNTNVATMDIGNLLQYALKNNIQIFELYPEEWLSANTPPPKPPNGPGGWPGFDPATQAKYQAALQAAAQVLGATNGK